MISSKHFSNAELSCRHCGVNGIDPDFLDWLETVREEFGKPMVVSSGYRCPDHNESVSRTGRTGPHTTGKAVDIKVNGLDAVELDEIATRLGVRGKGVKQKGNWGGRFLHLDLMTRRAIWSY